jgi:hypothetical protein
LAHNISPGADGYTAAQVKHQARSMISRDSNPLGWSFLLDELADAHEHLGNLLGQIQTDRGYSETEFRTDLGHVYAHLNRAWRRRDVPEDFTSQEWQQAGAFPDDIEPVA